ncbi:MAG: hypothetical protein ACUVWO_01465 [Thermodesulfobacteriota bacterium]
MKHLGIQRPTKEPVAVLKQKRAKLKREPSVKLDQIKLKLQNRDVEIQSLKERLAQREAEVNQLREQIEYQNQKLASKDMEMESYRKVTEERIFQLEARIKQYEAKIRKTRS